MRIEPELACLVTGASSGIGRQIALDLGRRKARVGILARSPEPLDELAEEIRRAGGQALALVADVRDEAAMASAVGRLVETWGGLRLVVANAGLGRYAPVDQLPPDDIETTIGINYVGMTRTVRLTLPHLLAATPSHLVGVTSSAGLIPHRLAAAYGASKAASNHFLATTRLEIYDRGVGVSWVCPGLVETPFVEKSALVPDKDLPLLARWLVRPLKAEEVSRATLRAIERDRCEVVLPLMMRFFAWSRRLTPRLADWLNRKTG